MSSVVILAASVFLRYRAEKKTVKREVKTQSPQLLSACVTSGVFPFR